MTDGDLFPCGSGKIATTLQIILWRALALEK